MEDVLFVQLLKRIKKAPGTMPIKVGIMLGSKSDFKQCIDGFKLLKLAEERKLIKLVQVRKNKTVNVNSIHRHNRATRKNLRKMIKAGVDVIIAGAGKAAHLPGMLDSDLRYELRNSHVSIIAVAFEGKITKDVLAATLSISEVPKHQMIFTRNHRGANGFLLACKKAIAGDFPEISLPGLIPDEYFTLEEAIEIGTRQLFW
jgi:phosphoribosylcarboxyaminoimidazole (NCAIR) mutase